MMQMSHLPLFWSESESPHAAELGATSLAPVQTFLEAPGLEGPLKGSMLAPASTEAPMMLIVPGSGPTDRDGNSPLGVNASTYRLLAEGLAACGIGTVRVDKCGMFGSKAAVADANAVTIDRYVADIDSWITTIRNQTNASCVWLLGHSEGGVVALAAAQRTKHICGLVLVSAPGRPMGEVLLEQLRSNPANGPILDQATAAIDALQAGKRVDVTGMHPALLPLFGPHLQDFLISLFSFDPAKLISTLCKPLLIMQGERDLQIGVADAERLKRAAPKAELVLLADTNHILKTICSDDRQANFATYADPNMPLAAGVVDAVVSFVTTTMKSPARGS